MSVLGEAMGVLGLFGKAWAWLRDRLDPARAQAQRLIQAFEAYGVVRQQIPRLLPPAMALPNVNFSSPDKLKDKLTPALLDWVAEHLALNRSWLDGVAAQPHLIEDHYKSLAGYRNWLIQRVDRVPHVDRVLRVWKPLGAAIGPDASGPVCLVYEEIGLGLDGSEFSRFWRLSDEWPLDHPTCVENLIALLIIARLLQVLVVGHDVPTGVLRRLVAGKALIPDVAKHQRGRWHPEDLIEPLPGKDNDWRQARRQGALAYLQQAGLDVAILAGALVVSGSART